MLRAVGDVLRVIGAFTAVLSAVLAVVVVLVALPVRRSDAARRGRDAPDVAAAAAASALPAFNRAASSLSDGGRFPADGRSGFSVVGAGAGAGGSVVAIVEIIGRGGWETRLSRASDRISFLRPHSSHRLAEISTFLGHRTITRARY